MRQHGRSTSDKSAADAKKAGQMANCRAFVGLLLLAAVIYVAMHLGEGREFLHLAAPRRSDLADRRVLYQAATYVRRSRLVDRREAF